MSPSSVTVRVPASTSNLGPGFDTLGLALRLHNRVTVERTAGSGLTVLGAGSAEASAAVARIVGPVAELFFRRTLTKRHGLAVTQRNAIPVGRGLGASASLAVGVAAGLDALHGSPLGRHRLLDLVTETEGHPDNATPSIFGGFTASTLIGKEARSLRFLVSAKATFVTLVPDFEVSTPAARELVPAQFSKADTVHAITRVAVIPAAFASGDLEALRGCFDDRIHQPYRAPLIPQLGRVIQAGEKAGAIGGWLSGSGSAIMCVTFVDAEAVGRAMQRASPGSEVLLLKADRHGFVVRGCR